MNITTSNITPQPTSFITAQYVVLHYLSVEQTPFRHAERFLPIMECNKETSSTCHRKLIIQMDLLPALFILHCLYSIRFHSELWPASGSFGRCFWISSVLKRIRFDTWHCCVDCSATMKCGGKSDSFWKFSRWKSRWPLTAHSCYDRMNLVCKFFGIVPAFSINSKQTPRRWILQVLNYLVMIAVMLLYAWIMQLAVGDAVTQRTKSVIMGRVMESVNSHYGSLILVSLFVGQQLHSKTSEVPHVLHFADCQLKRFGFVVELKRVYWFMNGCLILSVIVSSALCKGSISIMERHAEVCSSVKRTIIVLQYVLTSYAVMCLHATFCVISIAIRFRALNRLLR